MSSKLNETLPAAEGKTLLNKISDDLLRPLQNHKGFTMWALFLGLALALVLWAYVIQLRDGLSVTAMRDYSAWGSYIANFVFFVAVSLVGMLISAIMGLLGTEWAKPISRIAEIVAFSAVAVAGLVIVFDMGRPDRLHHVFLYGRFQSPILWDVTVVTTYTAISLVLLILPLIPDIAIMRKRLTNLPKWQQKLYELASFGWVGNDAQYHALHRMLKVLMILVIPVALAIHTVTSWLMASTLRPGWNSTIFGPYFVTGAFVAGTAAVMILMFFYRNNFKLKEYLTDYHFDKVSQLLVLTSLVYLYFNINEYLVPGYKMPLHEGQHLHELMVGHWAPLFWATQIGGLVLPIILLLFKPMRKPLPATIIAVFVLVGAWFKRFIIVVPTQFHPFLPIQNVPEEFTTYSPTLIEIAVLIMPFILALIIGTIVSKLIPVVSIWEVAEQKGVSREVINQD